MFSLPLLLLSALAVFHAVVAFDISRSDNLVLYWGQNSYGATHSDVANFQKRLGFYCTSDSVTDTFPMAFLTVAFGEGGLPSIDLANICNPNDNATFPGTELPNCSALASDIQTCQAAGKIITLSIGGATGAISFTSDTQAQTFADTIWNIFLGGSSSTRPFGAAVLDGIDLDIEGGGSSGYAAFVTRIRSHAVGANKRYYVTAAPQCPFPDANLGAVINAVGFDAVYVQFYNNFCGLQNFNNPNDWNFATWDNWAKTTSPNPNVKIYIGAPASSTAAGSGFVDAATLANIIKTTRATYSSFGGVMMWDASQAYANGRYDIAAKNAMTGGTAAPSSSTTRTSTSTTTTRPSTTSSSTRTITSTSSTAVPTSGSCAGVAPWSSSVAYVGGSQVTFNGHLWTAKWWSEADTPGGVAGDWQDDGACTTKARVVPTVSASDAGADADATPALSLPPASESESESASSLIQIVTARSSESHSLVRLTSAGASPSPSASASASASARPTITISAARSSAAIAIQSSQAPPPPLAAAFTSSPASKSKSESESESGSEFVRTSASSAVPRASASSSSLAFSSPFSAISALSSQAHPIPSSSADSDSDSDSDSGDAKPEGRDRLLRLRFRRS